MYRTDQEIFWAGAFGDEYIDRNRNAQIFASSLNMFSKIISYTENLKSVIEYGPNIGINLRAIQELKPSISLAGVEINQNAAKYLESRGDICVYNQSILDFKSPQKFDMVYTRGVLIHINPEYLPEVYDSMYSTSNRYIMVAEYYNPSPMTLPYRGELEKLFKRDFAGDLMDRYPDLKLISYGFEYHRDQNFQQDDITWFLMEKRDWK